MSVTFACVRTGPRYGPDYVHKLRDGIARHYQGPHRFVCLTDTPDDLSGVEVVDVSDLELPGWWAKLALLDLASRSTDRVIYLDLDMVICGSLARLAGIEVDFAICGSFTRAAGNLAWPCRYGSCVMSFAPGFGRDGWLRFSQERDALMRKAGTYGDQLVFEWLYPAATLLQDVLPAGFFVGYRDLSDERPRGCSVVVFAGRSKPHNCEIEWIRDEWK